MSWGIPGIFVIIILLTGAVEVEKGAVWYGIRLINYWFLLCRCSLTKSYEWALWFVPMIFTVLINLIFYILIVSKFQRHRKVYNIKRQLTLYLLAFVLCWIWDIVDHIIQPYCTLYWLWLLQDFFSPLQGFLNFIVYGLSTRLVDFKSIGGRPKSMKRMNIHPNEKATLLSKQPSNPYDL